MVFRLIILGLFLLNLEAKNTEKVEIIEVSAKNYFLDEKKGFAFLSGEVLIKKEKDILKAGKLHIKMQGKRAIKYEAREKPSFRIVLGDKSYEGKGDLFVYDVKTDIYEIIGNAYIKELNTSKELMGDKIIIDRKKLIYRVQSKDSHPAKFIFELHEK